AGRVLAQVTLGQHLALRRWLDRAAGELPAARRGGPRGHPADQEPSVVRRLGHRGEQGRQPHGRAWRPAQGVVAVRRPDPRQDDAVRLVAFQGRAADHRSVEQGGVGPDGRLPGVVHGPPVRRRQDGCRGLDQGQPVGVEELGAERLRHAPGSGLRDVTNDVHAGAVTVSTGPCGTLESRTWTTSVWAAQTSRQSPPSPLLWLLLRQRAASGNASATSMQSPPVPLLLVRQTAVLKSIPVLAISVILSRLLHQGEGRLRRRAAALSRSYALRHRVTRAGSSTVSSLYCDCDSR